MIKKYLIYSVLLLSACSRGEIAAPNEIAAPKNGGEYTHCKLLSRIQKDNINHLYMFKIDGEKVEKPYLVIEVKYNEYNATDSLSGWNMLGILDAPFSNQAYKYGKEQKPLMDLMVQIPVKDSGNLNKWKLYYLMVDINAVKSANIQ